MNSEKDRKPEPRPEPPPGTLVQLKGLTHLHGRLYHAGDVVEWQKGWGPPPKGAKIVEMASKKGGKG